MSLVTKHRFSVEDYYRMAKTGLLGPDARVELLDGEIVDMSPIGPFHAGVVSRLLRFFARMSSGRFLVTVQNPVRLNEHSELQPDVMLLKPSPEDYTTRHPSPTEVFLLIEVAASSLAYDRGTKLPAYGRSGISEVWIVNLEDETIEVCREPHLTGYASTTLVRPGEQACSFAFPDAAMDVADLFKRA